MRQKKLYSFILALLSFFIVHSALAGQEDITSSRNTAVVRAAKRVGPAVVTIKTLTTVKQQRYVSPYHDNFFDDFFQDFFGEAPQKEHKQQGLGSGVIISADGYILTNEHVIHGADEIKVKLPDGNEYEGKLEAADKDSDIALVKINSKKDFPFAPLGDSDDLQVGEWVVAIGNPFGFIVDDPRPTVTVGVVSALDRSIKAGRRRGEVREYNNLVQTDAAINPGNSGGPLVNILGEVIGINTAIFSTSGGSVGIGFAISINTARRIKDDLLQYGRVIRPMIGIQLQSLNKKWTEYYNLKKEGGVMVVSVIPNSPAEKAGIKRGDILLKLDGKEIEDAQAMVGTVKGLKVGDEITLDILRDRKEMIVKVVLEEKDKFKKIETKSYLGIKVEDISSELAGQYNLSDNEGVIITEIDVDGPAFRSGLRRGDIIREINRYSTNNLSDFEKVLKKLDKKETIYVVVNRRGLLLLASIEIGESKK